MKRDRYPEPLGAVGVGMAAWSQLISEVCGSLYRSCAQGSTRTGDLELSDGVGGTSSFRLLICLMRIRIWLLAACLPDCGLYLGEGLSSTIWNNNAATY